MALSRSAKFLLSSFAFFLAAVTWAIYLPYIKNMRDEFAADLDPYGPHWRRAAFSFLISWPLSLGIHCLALGGIWVMISLANQLPSRSKVFTTWCSNLVAAYGAIYFTGGHAVAYWSLMGCTILCYLCSQEIEEDCGSLDAIVGWALACHVRIDEPCFLISALVSAINSVRPLIRKIRRQARSGANP